ncbi:MAG: hypothetical protein ABI389_05345 [Rhodanobacter sp.]
MTPIIGLSVPRLHQDLIVFDDDSGHTPAFGPGWPPGSAVPGMHGLSVIGAHRNAQFRFLPMLWPGDRRDLDGLRGGSDCQVTAAASSTAGRLYASSRTACPGTECLVPAGPLRHVVQACRTNLNAINSRSSATAGTNAAALGQTLGLASVPLCRGTCRCEGCRTPPGHSHRHAPIDGVPSHVSDDV